MNLYVTLRESLCLCCRVDVIDKAASSSYLSPSATHQSDVGQPSVPPQLPLHKIVNSTTLYKLHLNMAVTFSGKSFQARQNLSVLTGSWPLTPPDTWRPPPSSAMLLRPCTALHCSALRHPPGPDLSAAQLSRLSIPTRPVQGLSDPEEDDLNQSLVREVPSQVKITSQVIITCWIINEWERQTRRSPYQSLR